jgi:hypothetical protein
MTTAEQIIEVLKEEQNFAGVFLYDQLDKIPLHKIHKKCIIVNYITLDEAEQGKVGHYVCCDWRSQPKADSTSHAYFFDPYGLEVDEGRDVMHLDNTHEIAKLFKRVGEIYTQNDKQWQVLAPWDELCGVYSCAYVMNPLYKTNPIFHPHQNRSVVDKRLTKLFVNLGFVKP